MNEKGWTRVANVAADYSFGYTNWGQRDIRRLLITGAMAVVRAAIRTGNITEGWLAGMPVRKPRLVVAIALANKMARSIWAMLVKGEEYRDPVAARA